MQCARYKREDIAVFLPAVSPSTNEMPAGAGCLMAAGGKELVASCFFSWSAGLAPARREF